MLNRLRLISVAACLVSLEACTSLSTRADLLPKTPSDEAMIGAPYSLPMLQYDLAVSRTLAQCTDPVTKLPALKFTMTVEATPRYVAGETYAIDYRRLSGWTKTSALTIEYQENSNILKSINASVEDRTAEIAGNVVKTGLGIASLVGGIPLPAAAPEGSLLTPKYMLICANGAQKLLDAVTLATAAVKDRTGKLKAATAAVDALSSRISALSDADRATLTRKIDEQGKAVKALAEAQAVLDEMTAAISYRVRLSWPRQLDETDQRFTPAGVGFERLAALVTTQAANGTENATDNRCDDQDVRRCMSKKLTAAARLAPAIEETRSTGASAGQKGSLAVKTSGTSVEGVLVRPPLHGRLLVCGASDTDCAEDDPRLVFRSDDAAVPQLGTLRFLPFRNKVFQNNSLVLSLTTSGDLVRVDYKNLKAQGEVLSTAALAAIKDVRAFADASAKRSAALEKEAHDTLVADRAAEIAAIQFELDKYKKQKELADAMAPTTTTVTLQADAAEVSARVALLQAQLAERQAQAALQQ